MASYKVLNPIKTEHGIVREGYVEIADGEVAELRRLGVIGEQEPVATQAVSANSDLIQAAIRQLDAADTTLWLKDGRPKTEAVSAVAGFAVSAAERDAAWAAVSAA